MTENQECEHEFIFVGIEEKNKDNANFYECKKCKICEHCYNDIQTGIRTGRRQEMKELESFFKWSKNEKGEIVDTSFLVISLKKWNQLKSALDDEKR